MLLQPAMPPRAPDVLQDHEVPPLAEDNLRSRYPMSAESGEDNNTARETRVSPAPKVSEAGSRISVANSSREMKESTWAVGDMCSSPKMKSEGSSSTRAKMPSPPAIQISTSALQFPATSLEDGQVQQTSPSNWLSKPSQMMGFNWLTTSGPETTSDVGGKATSWVLLESGARQAARSPTVRSVVKPTWDGEERRPVLLNRLRIESESMSRGGEGIGGSQVRLSGLSQVQQGYGAQDPLHLVQNSPGRHGDVATVMGDTSSLADQISLMSTLKSPRTINHRPAPKAQSHRAAFDVTSVPSSSLKTHASGGGGAAAATTAAGAHAGSNIKMHASGGGAGAAEGAHAAENQAESFSEPSAVDRLADSRDLNEGESERLKICDMIPCDEGKLGASAQAPAPSTPPGAPRRRAVNTVNGHQQTSTSPALSLSPPTLAVILPTTPPPPNSSLASGAGPWGEGTGNRVPRPFLRGVRD